MSPPELVTTLLPRLSDIMIQGQDLIVLGEDDHTLGEAQEIITGRRFAFLPVIIEKGTYAGKFSALRLASLTRELGDLCRKPDLSVRFLSFIESIGGRVLSGTAPPVFQGRLFFPSMGEMTPAADGAGVLAVLPDSGEAGLVGACDHGAGLIVICSTGEPDESTMARLLQRAACVVTTPHAALDVAARLCLSMPLRDFIEREHRTFSPSDGVREVRNEIRKSNEGGFVVVDDKGFIRGVITRLSFLTTWRFRVALVDHNELSQAVDGVEEANVEEIIDHHRLGYRSTDQPITFINKVVGCTSTIFAELYQNSRRTPPPAIAGLMLAAILSDTVILQSPTTTPLDEEMARWLAALAGEDLPSFGARMFAAGCAAEGMDPHTVIRQDLKVYEESGWKLGVSQMETVGFEVFKEMSQALASELSRARVESGCHFSCLMVTDITSSSSLLLCIGETRIIDAVTYPRLAENLFEMAGVLSRKKQMMPYLADLVRQLQG